MTATGGPVWSGGGVTARPVSDWDGAQGVWVQARAGHLPPELTRSLRDWLSWWLGDHGESPPPTAPDVVRLVIDEQRAALRSRSAEALTEDFRAGLAWADNALAAIDRATRAKGTSDR